MKSKTTKTNSVYNKCTINNTVGNVLALLSINIYSIYILFFFTLIQLLYLGVSNNLSWVTARLISPSIPSVPSGCNPNSASETLLVITHSVKQCLILNWILCDLSVYICVQTRQKTSRWTRITDENKDVLHNMFDCIITAFDRMWQTFRSLSRLNITSFACLNMLFFEEFTCCLIVSLILFSESFPLNPAASAIKQKYVPNFIFCAMMMMCICVIILPGCICHDF